MNMQTPGNAGLEDLTDGQKRAVYAALTTVFERVKDEWTASHPGEELTFPNPEFWSVFHDRLQTIAMEAQSANRKDGVPHTKASGETPMGGNHAD